LKLKITFSSHRKERIDLDCMLPSTNYLPTKNLYSIFPNFNKGERNKINFFHVKTKKPTRVVLKSPFHYKVAKHRLTLLEHIYVREIEPDLIASNLPNTASEILENLDILVSEVPITTSSIMQVKSNKITTNFVLNKSFFNI